MKTWTELINPGGAIHEFIMSGTPEQKKQAIESLTPIAMFIDTYNAVTPDVKKKIDDLLLGRTVKPAANKQATPSRSNRVDALKRLLSFRVKNSVLPALDYVYIHSDGRMHQTDLTFAIGTKLPNYKATKDVMVPSELLKGLKEGDLLGCENNKLITSKGDFVFSGWDVNDFPALANMDNAFVFDIKQDIIDEIKRMQIFCGHDELRPVMSTVCMTHDSLAATDAHKLRWVNEIKTGLSEEFKNGILIPQYYLKYMMAGKCSVSKDGFIMRIETSDEFIEIRLTDGNYPNWPAVVPKSNPFKIELDRVKLITAIESLSKVWNKTTKQVVLLLTRNKLYAGDIDLSKELTLDMPVTHRNITQPEPYKNDAGELVTPDKLDWFDIGLNGQFLIDILKIIPDDVVTIEMSAPNRAIIINKNILLMPVMLNS